MELRKQIIPKLSKTRRYQLQSALALTAVPLFCACTLTALLYMFAELNLDFLETGGLMADDTIRQAYFYQVSMEFWDVWWLLALLFIATFGVSWMLVSWAVSPFEQGERILRQTLRNGSFGGDARLFFSESPQLTRVICGLGRRLGDPKHSYRDFPEVTYSFNFRYFLKFLVVFYLMSVITGYVLGSVFNAVYLKNVSLAMDLVKMRHYGHYFVAQERILRTVATVMMGLSFLAYLGIGVQITRYMSNMLFVFTRAIREQHFPLKLRDSDVYHSLADAISLVAEKAGLARGKEEKGS